MKKTVAFLLLAACILSLTACADFGFFGKDYEATDKSFEFEGLTITLTEAFKVDSVDSESVWYESSSETSVSIDRFPLSEMDKANLSLHGFASSLIAELPCKKAGKLSEENGLLSVECEVESLGFEFMYFICFYESADAYWMAYFMCDLEDYAEYGEHFVKWASSVVLPKDEGAAI